jgi:putative membrane protein
MKSLFTRLGNGSRASWTTLVGIILVPITVAVVFLWGLWNPQDRLEDVTAAVVNNDDPVKIDGETTPLGRELAAGLIGGDDDNLSWKLTDEQDATDGLDSGKYAAVVTIPKNFSKAATSASKGPDEVEQANISIDTSPRGRLLDSAISQAVAQQATRIINEKLGSSFVDNIFVGMNKIGSGVRDAASGAHELADGNKQLAGGANELAGGTDQLAAGTDQLAAGASELAGGASGLVGGIRQYVGGVSELSSGANDLAGGLDQLDSGLADAAKGTQDAANGQQDLADGVGEYVDSVNSIAKPAQDAVSRGEAGLEQLKQRIRDNDTLSDEAKATILESIDEIAGGLSDADDQVGQLIAGGNELKGGAQDSADGLQELAGGLSDLSGGLHESAGGAHELASGAGELADRGGELADGAEDLAGGAGDLASGTRDLAEQTPQLAEGAHGLADGTKKSAQGTEDLAGGLDDAAEGIPQYNKHEREKMSETAVTPVNSDSHESKLFHDNGVPLFTSIALWAGGLAAFALLAPLWRRARTAARSLGEISFRSSLTGTVLGVVQGLIAGIVLPIALGYSGAQFMQFLAISLFAGVAFALVNQGLVALFGGLGRFVSFVLLVVAFVAGVVSTVPGVLQSVALFTPLGAAFRGYQAVASSLSGTGIALFILVCWGMLGAALLTFAVARKRRATAVVKAR